ncbi:MAG TPA: hypothetical protein VFV19_00260 [Candidatus Polarisedimenticolaceae bacterium]|nr:hypothetical protein [Candidatus Polarisedimenticolaceae bacterium]
MKQLISIACLVALALFVAAPARAGEPAGQTTLKGWVVDDDCGAKNANAAGADCIKMCQKNGAKLVLYVDGKTYGLSDQKLALANVGHEVAVTGTVDKNGNVTVAKMETAKKTS